MALLRRILGKKVAPPPLMYCRCGCAWPCKYLASQADAYPMHRPIGSSR